MPVTERSHVWKPPPALQWHVAWCPQVGRTRRLRSAQRELEHASAASSLGLVWLTRRKRAGLERVAAPVWGQHPWETGHQSLQRQISSWAAGFPRRLFPFLLVQALPESNRFLSLCAHHFQPSCCCPPSVPWGARAGVGWLPKAHGLGSRPPSPLTRLLNPLSRDLGLR